MALFVNIFDVEKLTDNNGTNSNNLILFQSVNSMEGSELSEISSIMGASTIHNRRNPRNLQSIFKMGKNIE